MRVVVAAMTARLGQQARLDERGLHGPVRLAPGEGRLVAVEGLQVGLLAGEDCWLPEAARLLQLAGAQLICFLPRPAASAWDQLAGPWSLIQSTQLFGIEASPANPRILAPCELTPDGSGILGTEADLAPEALPVTFRRFLRPDFYLRHFPW